MSARHQRRLQRRLEREQERCPGFLAHGRFRDRAELEGLVRQWVRCLPEGDRDVVALAVAGRAFLMTRAFARGAQRRDRTRDGGALDDSVLESAAPAGVVRVFLAAREGGPSELLTMPIEGGA